MWWSEHMRYQPYGAPCSRTTEPARLCRSPTRLDFFECEGSEGGCFHFFTARCQHFSVSRRSTFASSQLLGSEWRLYPSQSGPISGTANNSRPGGAAASHVSMTFSMKGK